MTGRVERGHAPPQPAFLPPLAIGTLCLCLVGCGERPGDKPVKQPRSHLAGIDRDKPTDGQPGRHRKSILTRHYDLEPWAFNVHAEPFMIGAFRQAEHVWITRWESNTEDEDGECVELIREKTHKTVEIGTPIEAIFLATRKTSPTAWRWPTIARSP